ncbi:MAG: hypothetical protein KC502_15865 [Myxococcales bacterium]|nr:hypothetical protein [Myxococcales bacterium]
MSRMSPDRPGFSGFQRKSTSALLGWSRTLAVVLALVTAPVAWAAPDADPMAWEATGALRGLGSAMTAANIDGLPSAAPGSSADVMAASVLRGILSGRTDNTRVELNVFADVSRSPQFGNSALSTVGGRRSAYRNPQLSHTFLQEDSSQGSVGLDRLTIRHIFGDVTVAVGRMPVSLSVTSLFTPNDFFAPFSASSINRVYKPGVDAAEVTWSLGAMSSLSLLGVAGWDTDGAPQLDSSAALLRGSTLVGSFQLSVLAGRLGQTSVLGLSAQGDVGEYNLRFEGHVARRDADSPSEPKRDDIYGRMAIGFDTRWVWRNASVMVESMFISDGAGAPSGYLGRAVSLSADELPMLGRMYAAAAGGFELLPIVRVGGFSMVNLADLSGLLGLSLAWSVADEIDVSLGAFVPWGKPGRIVPLPSGLGGATTGGVSGGLGGLMALGSEFGASPTTAYLEARWYF